MFYTIYRLPDGALMESGTYPDGTDILDRRGYERGDCGVNVRAAAPDINYVWDTAARAWVPSLERHRDWALAEVNRISVERRNASGSSLPFQDTLYARKLAEASALMAGGAGPLLELEATISSTSAQSVAVDVLAQASTSQEALAVDEASRAASRSLIRAAGSLDEIYAIVARHRTLTGLT